MNHFIEIRTIVHAPIEKAWDVFTNPDHIRNWNHANDDWHCPKASSDLRDGGSFSYTMAAKDGSFSFDLEGSFNLVQGPHYLHYTLADGRNVEVKLMETGEAVQVLQRFQPEQENPEDLQRQGWQAILDNFARHASG